MTTRMLIDATHPEETRVAVVDGNKLQDFDFEIAAKKQLKGNIYLAKVTRVEPSLQAAFVDYGGNRHGFLSFQEIHPDYYRIPVSDREALMAAQAQAAGEDSPAEGAEGEEVEVLGGEDSETEAARPRIDMRSYAIQEVIKRRQVMLIQVVKEERGTKGAALTTFISLAGRYCVLMPNSPRGGGVSRKIAGPGDRKRMKEVLAELDVPEGMSVILRTAGVARQKSEIKRDFDYLLRLWDNIRELTLSSNAPALVHEEGNLVKRAIRDLYTRDIDEVLVAGEDGYRVAKQFMRMMIPSHAKKVQRYRDATIPMFNRYQVETQLDVIHSPEVPLKSGGYIVINPTEALVSIDVNSGKATRERNVEETALQTNLEAAEEVARQLRLRDLAGLVVIDFIDMEENKNTAQVERRLKEALKRDRARIQVGRISHFGLLEMSRQRLRPSLTETAYDSCPRCAGTGLVRSTESAALHVLRAIEEEGIRQRSAEVTLFVPTAVALYILNQKRDNLNEIERRHALRVYLDQDDSLIPPDYRLEHSKTRTIEPDVLAPALAAEPGLEPEAGDTDETPEAEARAEDDRRMPAESATTERTERAGEDDENDRGGRSRGGRKRRRGGQKSQPRSEGRDKADAPADSRAEAEGKAEMAAQAGAEAENAPPSESKTASDAASDAEARAKTDAQGDTPREGSNGGQNGRKRRRGKRGGRRRSRRQGEARPAGAQDSGADMSSSRTEADTDTDTGTGSGSGTDIQARNASAETAAEARAAETETGPMPLPELPEDADWTDESLARLGNRPEDGGERTPPGDPDTSAESLATGWDGPTAAEDPDARALEAEFEAYEPPRGEKEGESDQGPRRRGFLSKLLG